MPARFPPLAGIVFDMDDTLVDTGLDFHLMRQEMKLPAGMPILEALAEMHGDEADHCRAILHRHEQAAVERAVLEPGVLTFLEEVERRGLPRAVLTRNSRAVAAAILARVNLHFSPVISREDGPAKPDPTALLTICRQWELPPERVAIVGDFRFDIETGRRAGTRTVLYTRGIDPDEIPWADEADFVLRSFQAATDLWNWLTREV